ncbi:Saccharopine dehydrogenase-domain-containing protein [Annulohypoxylon maeteangense]|uniref:Saccharopine dehydrogenase-domain-containing protein n=1 Tax=Annulohypoxylon maeteangense TaxID=1927788 RepID=UPI002007245C|nr:Saccharopine dehydrogenase-domain-containing protein [Annulohypoxylon maeteangense]KAI0879879.1 Saccharopine dehydrogenase-domain-containing protein [Annulohypoxylon maeteangense]
MTTMSTDVKARRKPRKYDILLLGATGYTGSLTAEHIVRHLPADLKWAIAGRSKSKLEVLARKLKDLEPERLQPEIEAISFDDGGQLDSVVKNSKVCISVVLYWRVGEAVVKSCVENGTDYIDVAGDIPLLHTFVEQYHDAAVNAGVALIHLCGVFTGPHDLLTWTIVRELARKTSRKTKEVILSVTELRLSPSGGTADSLMAESTYEPRAIEQARQPWVLSPVEGVPASDSTDFLGLRRDPVLGLLSASSFSAAENRALVHRTWGLLKGTNQEYGLRFQYNEYNKVSSTAAGVFSMLTTAFLNSITKFDTLKRIARLFLPTPGDGPDVEKERHSRVKFEAVAIAESADDGEAPRAYASFSYPSGGYFTTALFLAQGAASLLYTRNLESQVVGGCLTPAFLGDDLLDRIQAAGATFHVNLV